MRVMFKMKRSDILSICICYIQDVLYILCKSHFSHLEHRISWITVLVMLVFTEREAINFVLNFSVALDKPDLVVAVEARQGISILRYEDVIAFNFILLHIIASQITGKLVCNGL